MMDVLRILDSSITSSFANWGADIHSLICPEPYSVFCRDKMPRLRECFAAGVCLWAKAGAFLPMLQEQQSFGAALLQHRVCPFTC